MASKCDECKGEGGEVVWLNELGDQTFLPCPSCNGRGFREEGVDSPPPSEVRSPTGSHPGADGETGSPSGPLLPEREPFDAAWNRMEHASEEELRREERA